MWLKTGRLRAVHGAWPRALRCAGFGPETFVCLACAWCRADLQVRYEETGARADTRQKFLKN